MGNVIDFKSRKDERIMERIEGLKAECKLLDRSYSKTRRNEIYFTRSATYF